MFQRADIVEMRKNEVDDILSSIAVRVSIFDDAIPLPFVTTIVIDGDNLAYISSAPDQGTWQDRFMSTLKPLIAQDYTQFASSVSSTPVSISSVTDPHALDTAIGSTTIDSLS